MLELDEIFFHYRNERWVLQDLSLRIKEGYKRVGIVGENGSGKSTLLKIIARILQPQKGNLFYKGKDLREYSSRELAKLVSFLGPGNHLELGITVLELAKLGRYPYLSFMSPLSREDWRIIDWALEITDMERFKHKFLIELSSGEKQRARLARALVQDTNLLLLDEPTTFLDPRHWVKLLEVLKDVSKQRFILIASHDLSFLRLFAEHIYCLKEGRLVYDGEPYSFWDSSFFIQAFGVEPEMLKPESSILNSSHKG
ncbi:MAG: Fe(3+) dicitrate transport ATP-binding protein FecE [candidate division WS2 bacterium]|nr:Fe(3+) dicitrate transport ATP-binding protein FecE [Candidatus Psychracetigena formicireducens]MBT9149994.1 Fe(3+) dicitrate transport ATP-binding protein FecE [Candidatus Psychracetigena formicireducens]